MSAHQGRRQDWLDDHADTLAYRDELRDAVAERRHELGLRAAITQPDHLVRIFGPVPDGSTEAIRLWTSMAGRIEAYREEWEEAAERLGDRPGDACQEQLGTPQSIRHSCSHRVTAPAIERDLAAGSSLSGERTHSSKSPPEGKLPVHRPVTDARCRQRTLHRPLAALLDRRRAPGCGLLRGVQPTGRHDESKEVDMS